MANDIFPQPSTPPCVKNTYSIVYMKLRIIFTRKRISKENKRFHLTIRADWKWKPISLDRHYNYNCMQIRDCVYLYRIGIYVSICRHFRNHKHFLWMRMEIELLLICIPYWEYYVIVIVPQHWVFLFCSARSPTVWRKLRIRERSEANI